MRVLVVASTVLIAAAFVVEPRTQASVSRCPMSVLSPRLAEPVSPTTGAHPIALRLVNRGRRTCALRGYPVVALSDERGIIPFVYRHGGDMMVTSRPPTLIELRTGQSAYVLIDKFRCDLGDVRTSTSVQISIRGSTFRSRLIPLPRMRISLCKPGISAEGRVVNVSPFESTLRATLRG
jgi:hypothetical protein